MIGIIPIGGHATRMNGIPKFLLPVGDTFLLAKLYREMQEAGAETIAIGVKASNRALVEQNVPDDALIYEVNTETMSQTVLHARQHIDMTQPVLFGMPDTYWATPNMFSEVLAALERDTTSPIAACGAWDTPKQYRHKRGMLQTTGGFLSGIIDKPQNSDLNWGWGTVVWKPAFWQYINPYDKHVGFALQRAIEDDANITSRLFWDHQFFDCGTPDEYYDCIRSIEWSAHVSA